MPDTIYPPPTGAYNAPLHQTSLQRDLPQRRSVRLPEYDYSHAGWYFVTIMAENGVRLFGDVTQEGGVQYTPVGAVVCQCWVDLAARYILVHSDAWILMPNHLHLIIDLMPATSQAPARTLGQLVAAFKATTTRLTRPLRASTDSLWQRSYHEHIIRTATELEVYRTCIQHNPRRWLEKKLPAQHRI